MHAGGWAILETLEVIVCALIRRGVDATVLAADLAEPARVVLASCEDREAAFTKALILKPRRA